MAVGNHKLFLLFIGYTALLCVYALVLLTVHYLTYSEDKLPEACWHSPEEQLAGTTVAVLAMLFGLFTICMLFDQCSNIETGLTKVRATRKHLRHRCRTPS